MGYLEFGSHWLFSAHALDSRSVKFHPRIVFRPRYNNEREAAYQKSALSESTLGGVYIFSSTVNPLLYAVWLPHEDVTIKATDGIRVVKGYVLSDSNGWVSVLRTGQRRIYRFPSSEVTKRDLCSAGRCRTLSFPTTGRPLIHRGRQS